MSGRHRRTTPATARRALAVSVPALGLVGAATALAGGEPTAESEPLSEPTAATTPVADTSALAVDAATAEPAVVTVASDAARAAGLAGERQRVQERLAIENVVDDVRTDARAREAAAAAQGQQELEQFRRDAARHQPQQQESRPSTDPEPDRIEDGTHCDTTGMPLFGDRTDGDEIVGRHCGLTDLFGRQRSSDPWIDGQLLSSGEE